MLYKSIIHFSIGFISGMLTPCIIFAYNFKGIGR
jgi:hypothetical protein